MLNGDSEPERNKVESVIGEMLSEARSGDHASAAMTAMLIHRYPEESRGMGIASLYESLLLQALQSSDGELLACLAEELMLGVRLAGDAKMAHRAVNKADDVSGFMGAYVLGRMAARSDPDFAIRQFRKGYGSGHIASLSSAHHLMAEKVPFLKPLIIVLLGIGDSLRAMRAVFRKDRLRLWRALDVMRPKEYFEDIVGGPDRKNPFSSIDELLPISEPDRAPEPEQTRSNR